MLRRAFAAGKPSGHTLLMDEYCRVFREGGIQNNERFPVRQTRSSVKSADQQEEEGRRTESISEDESEAEKTEEEEETETEDEEDGENFFLSSPEMERMIEKYVPLPSSSTQWATYLEETKSAIAELLTGDRSNRKVFPPWNLSLGLDSAGANPGKLRSPLRWGDTSLSKDIITYKIPASLQETALAYIYALQYADFGFETGPFS